VLEMSERRAPDTELRARLRDLANQRRRFGYRRLFILLRDQGDHPGSTASTGSIARRDWLCANAEVAARQWVAARPFSSRPSQTRAGHSTSSTISSPAAGASVFSTSSMT